MNEISEMKADMVKNLAILLMNKNKGMELNEALAIIFNSDTYQKVMDDKAGLYYQSPIWVSIISWLSVLYALNGRKVIVWILFRYEKVII